jgi:acyl transferase domain-containing protein
MEAQKKLIEECYSHAGLNLADTGYVEAHMTGTPSGDPIEAEAIAQTFGKHRSAHDPVLVGGIKANIGHTEPVSGLAAIIKTIFAFRNGVIPPNVNYEKTNPKIPLEKWHLQVRVFPKDIVDCEVADKY